MPFLSQLNKAARILFCAFLIWLFIHLFLFQALHVPTASMRPTLLEGDYILVNKTAYGPRLPITPLSLPFGGLKAFVDWIQLPYLRIPGYASVEKNDVIVFNLPTEADIPVDEKKLYVKRCVALPGETLRVDSGKVFIDGALAEIKTQGSDSLLQKKEYYNPSFFPNNSSFKWNLDFFGPLVIPKKDERIQLTVDNICLYQSVIEKYENNQVEIKNKLILINGKEATSYVFKMNYYFVLGDNRHNSIDSRIWGFVPENHLVGRASIIIHSSRGNLLSVN